MMGTNFLTRYRHIAPLAVFRIAFGAVLFYSTVRFIAKGWVYDFYIKPKFHFPFFGFEWLHPLESGYMYALYVMMAIAALFICLGLFYRLATPVFFLCFCYAELLDKTYYLNHYYLVTIISFLLIFVPANRYFSIDLLREPSLEITQVPAWTIWIFKLQLCIIYFFAGLSKLTSDWLLHAMPLKIWLLAKANVPLIGPLLAQSWTAYFFSWAGALFDLSIPFLLLNKSTRTIGYLLVLIFHSLTAVLFQIGMFPYLMISATLIFFSENFHVLLINKIRSLFNASHESSSRIIFLPVHPNRQKLILGLLTVYFFIQLLMPARFLLYPGKLLWTEEGYRFSWRVMLMEKSGAAFFYIKDPASGRKFEVNTANFLTAYQERMMETQPDMMLQYAHILQREYQKQGIQNPEVTVQSYVSLNGSGSMLYIDSTVNLANEKESWFGHKSWILPFTDKRKLR
ncbi:MAG: HTTM domain-containing protein [Bacteroidetes bacterium]|nr:HTTM domain-containing protein [Bacteroidota bacterium]